MTATPVKKESSSTIAAMVATYGPIVFEQPLSKEQFINLAERYPDLQMERDKNGKTSIMSPVKKVSGKRESTLLALLFIWNNSGILGEVYVSSAGFDLPDGATRSPDVAWISKDRLENAPGTEEDFIKTVPDFIAKIRSASDRLPSLKNKITKDWLPNGVRLAWLIDPYEENIWIYRAGQDAPEVVEGFAGKRLSDATVLPGFELPLDTMRREQ